jgi:hypothetical protein
VPKLDMLVSGMFHNLPYPGNNFPSVANQSIGGVATASPSQTTFGRPFSNGQAVTFLNIVFNLFNWSTPDVYSTFPYGPTYLNATNITGGAVRQDHCAVQFLTCSWTASPAGGRVRAE